MTGAGDEIAAGLEGGSHWRVSYADREQVIETLKAAFVQGRLTKDEFEVRVGPVFRSRTCAELTAVAAGIPAWAAVVQPLRAPARRSVTSAARALGWGAGAAIPLAVMLGVVAVLTGNVTLLALSIFAVTGVTAVACGAMVEVLTQQRSRVRPRGPAGIAGGQASQRLPSADPGRQLPPGDDGHWHAAEAAPIIRLGLLPS